MKYNEYKATREPVSPHIAIVTYDKTKTKRYEVCYLGIRKRFVDLDSANAYLDEIERKRETIEFLVKTNEDYPLTLIDKLLEERSWYSESPDMEYAIENIDKNLMLYFQKYNDNKTYQFLNMRFKNGYTLEEMGKFYNVTRERIRQIEHRMIFKLSHNKLFMDYLFYGQEVAELKRKNEMLVKELEEENKRYEELLKEKEGINSVKEKENKELLLSNRIANEFPNGLIEDVKKDAIKFATFSVDNANFTTRTYNALRRLNINNLGEIIAFINTRNYRVAFDKLLLIRNLGYKSVGEILRTLERVGYGIHYED